MGYAVETNMWCAVETAFVGGKHYKSRLLFDPNIDENSKGFYPGTFLCDEDEEPGNKCEKFMDGEIEIHTDWFQTKEQAITFVNGSTTYAIHRTFWYNKSTRSIHSNFLKWESVPALGKYLPFRGTVIKHYRDGYEVMCEQLMKELHDAKDAETEKLFYGYLASIGMDRNAVDKLYDEMFQ